MEVKAHVHLGIDNLTKKCLEFIDINVERIIDELAFADTDVMQILYLIKDALDRTATMHRREMLHITVKAAIRTAARRLHRHFIADTALSNKLMVFTIIDQTSIPSRERVEVSDLFLTSRQNHLSIHNKALLPALTITYFSPSHLTSPRKHQPQRIICFASFDCISHDIAS